MTISLTSRRRLARHVTCALLVTCLGLPSVALAAGTTVSLDGSGDFDVVDVDRGITATITLINAGADLQFDNGGADATTPVPPCVQGGDATIVTCPSAGVTRLDLDLGNYYDNVTVESTITIPARMLGGSGNDTLTGGAGADLLDGGVEDDTLRGGGGADDLIGGAGTDICSYEERTSGQPVTVTLGATPDNDGGSGGAEGDDCQTESIAGGAGADLLTGDSGPNGIAGGDGYDVIHGGAGNDSIDGGYFSTTGNELHGDAGFDFLGGDQGPDTMYGGDGGDEMRGYGGADEIRGEAGNDTIRGYSGNDDVYGGDGDDRVDSEENDGAPTGNTAIVDGGPGWDYTDLQLAGPCCGYGFSLTLDGVANDGGFPDPYNVMNVEDINMSGGPDTVTLSDASERINLGGGNDTVSAMGGDDTIIPTGSGTKLIQGGAGVDTVDYSQDGTCNVTLDGVANDGPGAADDNVLTENVISCDTGTVTGDAGPNVLMAGGDGTLTFFGGGGNDRLESGGGNDTLNGGDGDDLLRGGDGADTLNGDGGDDTLDGSVGGGGADVLDGGAGSDLADYVTLVTPLTITLDDSANDPGGDNVKTDNVRGGKGNDTITGDGGPNRLDGGPGNDTLNGGDGDDTFVSEPGADTLNGQGGVDLADYSAANGPVAVSLNDAADDGYGGEDDNAKVENVLGGDFADLLTGNTGANALFGGAGADTIDGGAGDDLLVGDSGTDTLTSGPGADELRSVDGEVDQLNCDVPTGKTIAAESIDTSTTCPLPAAPEAGGTTTAPAPATSLVTPPTFLPVARTARDLAAAVTGLPARGLTVVLAKRTAMVTVGELACTPGQKCAARVELLRGKRVVGKRTLTVDADGTDLTTRLSKAGQKLLRPGVGVKVAVRLTLVEGTTKATVRRTIALRLRKAKR